MTFPAAAQILLTVAEQRVFALAGYSALSRKEIGAQLHISPACVRFHLSSIYRKLGWKGSGSRIRLLQWCAAQENRNGTGTTAVPA